MMGSSCVTWKRPKVGLALGGGGARGFAHLGVLRALEQAKIQVDIVSGTSMGAVVGAAYAKGYRADEMIDMALEMRTKRILGLIDPVVPHEGVISGNRLEMYYDELVKGSDFDQLEKAMIVVATDINTGGEVRITSGRVAQALRASSSIPGLICPMRIGEHLLVDGCVTTPVPTAAAADAGATVVIAVDVSSKDHAIETLMRATTWLDERESPPNPRYRTVVNRSKALLSCRLPRSVQIVVQSLRIDNLSQRDTTLVCCAAYYLKPAVENVKWFEFHRVQECIEAGELVGYELAERFGDLCP